MEYSLDGGGYLRKTERLSATFQLPAEHQEKPHESSVDLEGIGEVNDDILIAGNRLLKT